MLRSSEGSETLALAVLGIGAMIVVCVTGPAAVVGVPLIAFGSWRWSVVAERTAAIGVVHTPGSQSRPWIAVSSIFLIAGSLGIHLGGWPGLPSLVMLLVGASVWCLIPFHRGLVFESEGRIAWRSLVITGGLSRCTALTLVNHAVQSGLSRGGVLVDSAERVVECLIVASSAACLCSLSRLWQSRKQSIAATLVVCVIQLQTAFALAAMATWGWSRMSPATGRLDALLPQIGDLPAALIVWDSLMTVLCCAGVAWGSSGRFRRLVSFVGLLALLDVAALPPLPGFWLKWWTIEAVLYPYHLELLAGMFDLHEGFRLLTFILVVGQTCVAIRLLTWLAMRQFSSTGQNIESSVKQPNGLDAGLASLSHE